MRSRGQSDLLSTLLIAGIIIGIGIMLWGIYSGYAMVERLKSSEELNKNLLVLRSMISADYVMYPGGTAILRNVGEEPVVIIRLITIRSDGEKAWDTGIGYWGELDVGDVGRFYFECPGCGNGPITLQVHYMPRQLFDPNNPTLIDPTSKSLLFRVASFTSEEVSSSISLWCTVPAANWSWIDFMDPFEAGSPAGSLTKWLKLRLPKDSLEERDYLRLVRIRIETESSNGHSSAEATVYSENLTDQWVDAGFQNRKYPIEIRITSMDDDWTIIQREWYFDAITRRSWWGGRQISSYVDLIKLFWDPFNHRVYQVFAKVYHNEDGWYRVTAILKCGGEVVAEGNLTRYVDVPGWGGVAYEDYVINIDPHPSMYSFDRVEVYVEKLS